MRRYLILLLAAGLVLSAPATALAADRTPIDPETYIMEENRPDEEEDAVVGEMAPSTSGNFTAAKPGTHYTAEAFARTPDQLVSAVQAASDRRSDQKSAGTVSQNGTRTVSGNTVSDNTVSANTVVTTLRNYNNRILRRVYNPNSGEHFYTASQKEYEHLGTAGWQMEGMGWIAPKLSTVPVYRLYNPNAGDHHYTRNEKERDHLIKVGWKDEGIGWYASSGSVSDNGQSIPVYRLYNPNATAGAHHYTLSAKERDLLKTAGWSDEGIGWYAASDEVQTEYEVIQQTGKSGVQSMFYTVTAPNGQIILIDGGWPADAETVRRVCAAYDNQIDAWIITHPHPDHIGAVNQMLEEHPEIRIGQIYLPDVNEERYRNTARKVDEIEYWHDFKSLSNGRYLIRLKELDTIDLFGLQMKVLHSWNATVDRLEKDLCNHGGLMFTLTGPTHSMLFCADLGKPVEEEILHFHRNELQADYVQCAHHGNWGFSTKLYDLIQPKAVFMDAPDSIIRMDHYDYDGFRLVRYWEERKIPIYSFRDGDSRVSL